MFLGEVFGCVLSLFMGSKNQPLPADEEVIVCDENTTAEEVNEQELLVLTKTHKKMDFAKKYIRVLTLC